MSPYVLVRSLTSAITGSKKGRDEGAALLAVRVNGVVRWHLFSREHPGSFFCSFYTDKISVFVIFWVNAKTLESNYLLIHIKYWCLLPSRFLIICFHVIPETTFLNQIRSGNETIFLEAISPNWAFPEREIKHIGFLVV